MADQSCVLKSRSKFRICEGGHMENKTDSRIISFDLVKINRGKEKICKCKFPHYEIDITNRLVMCTDCMAIVEPFDALCSLAENYEKMEDAQRKMMDKAKTYEEIANMEIRRMIKNRIFREMNEQYRRGMIPICPTCNKPFEPVEIKKWVNESLVD